MAQLGQQQGVGKSILRCWGKGVEVGSCVKRMGGCDLQNSISYREKLKPPCP